MADPLRYDSTKLIAARAAIANKSFDWLMIGDSVSEGFGNTDRTVRYGDRVMAALRARAGLGAGGSYTSGHFIAPYPANQWSYGRGTYTFRNDMGGLGMRSVQMTAGCWGTLPFTGTGVDFLYTKGPAAGLFAYAVDGGPGRQVQANAGSVSTGVLQIRSLAPGRHSLAVANVSASTYVEGAMVYNGDHATGFRLWDSAHAGWRTSDFLPVDDMWYSSVAATGADLVSICLGLNDYGYNPASGRVTPTQYAANVTSIVAKVRAKLPSPPSLLLIAPHERAIPSASSYTWADYVTALEGVASADGKAAFLDLRGQLGTLVGDPNNLDTGDQVHLGPGGQQLVADAVLSVLTNPVI